jgi:DNA adenine methylase
LKKNFSEKTKFIDVDRLDSLLPVFSWVGGKRRVIKTLKDNMPKSYSRYYELFAGGGALFFNLNKPNSTITDINSDVIATYKAIRDFPCEVMNGLDIHLKNQSAEYYYKIAKEFKHKSDVVRLASNFIYLIKASFGSKYVIKKTGSLASGYKGYIFKSLYNEDNILKCSKLLKKTTILESTYKNIIPSSNDFVYLDPPYDIEKKNQFNYGVDGFSESCQQVLKRYCDALTEKGVYFLLSNSNTPLINTLYKDYKVIKVSNYRCINSGHTTRSHFKEELLIKNY